MRHMALCSFPLVEIGVDATFADETITAGLPAATDLIPGEHVCGCTDTKQGESGSTLGVPRPIGYSTAAPEVVLPSLP